MQEENWIPANEFCIHHQIEMHFIQDLTNYGIIETVVMNEEVYIPAEQLSQVEKMTRLHHDLHVNIEGLDVIKNLLEKIEASQNELKQLRSRLRFYESNFND